MLLAFFDQQALKKLLIHTFCWVIFISYELSLAYTRGLSDPLIASVAFYGINISYFYFHAALLDYAFKRRRPAYVKGVVLISCLFLSFLLIKLLADYFFSKLTAAVVSPAVYFRSHTMLLAYRAFFFTLLSTFYWAAGNLHYYRAQKVEAERKELGALMAKVKLEYEMARLNNAFLQQQINPHLLFNTLNFIYNSVLNVSEAGAHCVLLLSEIMRFSLDAGEEDGKIPLIEEVAQVNRLIAINRYRFGGLSNLQLSIEGDIDHLRIIPLVLFTLTENLFKHADLRNDAGLTIIRLNTDGSGHLIFSTRNKKRAGTEKLTGNGLGLENVRLRLGHAYSNRYELSVCESNTEYEITLKIEL